MNWWFLVWKMSRELINLNWKNMKNIEKNERDMDS